jgi:hypothetical protein
MIRSVAGTSGFAADPGMAFAKMSALYARRGPHEGPSPVFERVVEAQARECR